MKITLLTDGISPFVMGGMQRHSALLAQYLAGAGVEVELYHTAYDPESIAQAKKLAGFPREATEKINNIFVDYPEQNSFPGHYLKESFEYSGRLLRNFNKYDGSTDFIYAKGLTGWAFLRRKNKGAALSPIAVNAHGYEMYQQAASLSVKLAHLLLRPAFRYITCKADYVFSYGGKITGIIRDTLRVDPEKIIEVPTGVDPSWLNTEPSRNNSPLRFLFVGRDERRKGIEELHQVLSLNELSKLHFTFVGPIPERLQLHRPFIHYHGPISDTAKLKAILDDADVLVCPSYSEGMPNVIVEAMARGLAIIATDVGAIGKLVDLTNGILIPRPSMRNLKNAIQHMLRLNPKELHGMKKTSLIRAGSCTWDRVAALTAQKIEHLLDQ